MRFIDLRPRWLSWLGEPIAILFLCPHCSTADRPKQWLTCFFKKAGELPAVVSDDEAINGERCERLLFEQAFREMGYFDPRYEAWQVVSCRPDIAWTRQGDDFDSMSIQPSIDASASGHWHGHITAGEIR